MSGLRMSQTKKVRDVRHSGRAALVVDGDNFEDTIVRIHPRRIISFGINPGAQVKNARTVAPA